MSFLKNKKRVGIMFGFMVLIVISSVLAANWVLVSHVQVNTCGDFDTIPVGNPPTRQSVSGNPGEEAPAGGYVAGKNIFNVNYNYADTCLDGDTLIERDCSTSGSNNYVDKYHVECSNTCVGPDGIVSNFSRCI